MLHVRAQCCKSKVPAPWQVALLLAGERLGDTGLMLEAFEALQNKSGIPQARCDGHSVPVGASFWMLFFTSMHDAALIHAHKPAAALPA